MMGTVSGLEIIHVTVDTQYDSPEDWYVIDLEKR